MVGHSKKHHRSRSPEYRVREHLRRYGLTPETYMELLMSQDGKCAICGSVLIPGKGTHVDHKDTIVRGILCNGCNWGLGNFKDNPESLRSAARYVEKYL